MTDDTRQHPTDDDARLDQVIRRARQDPDPNYLRPSDEAIEAYLLGTSSAEQRSSVLDALAKSSAFRRELLRMAEDIRNLESNSANRADVETQTAEAPNRTEFLEQRDAGSSPAYQGLPGIQGPSRAAVRRVLFPILGVAAVLALMFGGYTLVTRVREAKTVRMQQLFHWSLAESAVDVGLLVSNTTRNIIEPDTAAASEFARNAALKAFRHALSFREGVVQWNLDSVLSRRPEEPRSLLLRLYDEKGTPTQSLPVGLLESMNLKTGNIEGWVLSLPSRSLYSMALRSDTIDCVLPLVADETACLTVSYPVNGGYRAGVVYRIELDRH